MGTPATELPADETPPETEPETETEETPDEETETEETPGEETETEEGEETEPETEVETEGRCEADTTVGGTLYRCALDAGHDDQHKFQPVEVTDAEDDEQASLALFEKSQKRVVGYVDRYKKVLQEELGEEFEHLTDCPLCPQWTPGFFFPGQVLGMGDEQRIAVRLAIGDAELPSYAQDAHRKVCETCDGWGRVLTGSKRAQQDVLDCLDCKGRGFRSDQAATQAALESPEGLVVSGPWLTEGEPVAEEEPETDPWGTPPGAPYYGVMLNFRPVGWEEELAQWKLGNGVA